VSSQLQHNSRNLVLTVGNRTYYDFGIFKYGDLFRKSGANALSGYPGGFAVHTLEDGLRLIDERSKSDDWAVYRLDATWGEDTTPSKNGWWHALKVDSIVVERVWPLDDVPQDVKDTERYRMLDSYWRRIQEEKLKPQPQTEET